MSRKRDEVVVALTQEIVSGIYAPDTQLPTEVELIERFGYSRTTIRDALRRLATAGWIKSVHGHGWYVLSDRRRNYPILTIDSAGRATRPRDIWGNWLRDNDFAGSYQLTVTVESPPPHITNHLQLEPGEDCVIRRRLRFIDDHPVMICTGYWPLKLVEGTPIAIVGTGRTAQLDEAPLDIAARTGNEPVTERDVIGARMPTPEEIKDLKLPTGVPVITDSQTSYRSDGTPIRCTYNVIPASEFSLVMDRVCHPEIEGNRPLSPSVLIE